MTEKTTPSHRPEAALAERIAGLSPEKRALLELRLAAAAKDPARQPIPAQARGARVGLSYAQQRLWFLDRLLPDKAAYNIVCAWRLGGALNVPALERSFSALVARHETLRTRFAVHEDEPLQCIDAPQPALLTITDLGALAPPAREARAAELADAQVRLAFDLQTQHPLRLQLLRLSAQEHLLVLSVHHIAFDGWSMGVLERELSVCYAAEVRGVPCALAPLPIQYADYALWQRGWLQGEVLQQQLDYWTRQLEAVAPLELPCDRPRPPLATYRGALLRFDLPPGLTSALRALGRREGATLFMTLLAAFQVLLGRYSGQQDFAVGTPIAGRGRTELEGLIGFFVNTLVLRCDLSGGPSFRALLARVRDTALAAYAHQDLPFEKLVEHLAPAREMSRNPLFQVMFVLQNAPEATLALEGLAVSAVPLAAHSAKFDLLLAVNECHDGLQATFEYAADLFDAPTIARMARHWQALLEAAVADSEQPVARLPMLDAAERRQLLFDWNDTAAPYPRERCIQQLFEDQAALSAPAIALVCGDRQMTYAQLNARANQLAHHLISLGVGPESLVAVCMQRSIELVVSLLAVLKAGGAYVPLDPAYPPHRIAFMLHDTQAPLIITQHNLLPALPPSSSQVLCFDRDAASFDTMPQYNPPPRACADNLAYVIYTSGSTGSPKGILVEQRTLLNLMRWHVPTTSSGRVAQFTSISFDVSVQEMLYALLSARTLVVIENDTRLQASKLEHFLRQQAITELFVPNVVLEHYATAAIEAEGPPPAVDNVYQAGEALTITPAVRAFFARSPACHLHNHYGPAETHVATAYLLTGDPAAWPHLPSIGRPISNTRIYLLDAEGQPVPVGVAGEIYIGGDGVARGYLNRPELTAQKFLPDSFSPLPGARMYRTGDLARYRPDGNIEFLGRSDEQLKIRGFRIEPGEIEAALAAHPAVRQALVVAREDQPGDKRLIAYVVPESAAPCEPGALREFLRLRLPDYMLPAAFVVIEHLPLTANGKIDRRRLPAPAFEAAGEHAAAAPRDGLEELIAGVWREVLKVARLGVHDDFFELGGHSLLAAQVMARLSNLFRMDLPLRELFCAPTVAALATALSARLGTAQARDRQPIPAQARGARVGLSYAQQRLWFLDRLLPDKAAYNIVCAWRLGGALNVPALERSFSALVARHETLRTRFAVHEDEPLQCIDAPQPALLTITDLGALAPPAREARAAELADAQVRLAFDLQTQHPLRLQLLRLSAQEHLLVLSVHHIAFDGWSMGVLERELSVCYAAEVRGVPCALAPLPIQYADYALWQRGWLQGEVLQQQLDYWTRQLEAVAPLELPCDRPRPPLATYRGALLRFDLPPGLTSALRALGRREGATLFMTLLAAFQVLLGRYSGQQDFAVGTPIAGRGRTELEGLIGFFVNTLVLRCDLSGGPSFRALLARVRDTALAAYAHQDLPFEKLVEHLAPAREMSRNPLFQVMFVLQNAPEATLALEGLAVSAVPLAAHSAKFDLLLAVNECHDGLQATFEYAADLFDAPTIARMARHWQALLEAAVADSEQPVARLPMLDAAERRQLLFDWNDTAAPYPRERCIQQLFEDQAALSAPAIALVCGDRQMTYAQLNARANQLAHHLISLGVGPESLVAVCMQRSIELVVSLLAVLKAGGAYVPLDPAYPPHRIAFMLHDTQAPLIITQHNLLPALPPSSSQVLCFDRDAASFDTMPQHNPPDAPPQPTDRAGLRAAYVVYTSGSSGVPKGVTGLHQGIVNRLYWMWKQFPYASDETCVQKTSPTFVDSVCEIFGPLLRGLPLVIAPDDCANDPLRLIELLARHNVTRIVVVPSLLSALLDACEEGGVSLPRLSLWVTSGEALSVELARRFAARMPEARLINLYGSSEVSADVTFCDVTAGSPRAVIPIGRPIANTRIYILDCDGEPAGTGVPGELYVGGAGVARGYLNRADLTAEKFLPDPYARESGERMYRTGDLARFLADGDIEYLGRMDSQIKIRGFRIEPAEIESILMQHPAVQSAAVVARADKAGEQRLVAYVVPAIAAPLDSAPLRAMLRERLPDYMQPAAFVPLDRLPLTPNGKLDRRALPTPSFAAPAKPSHAAPTTRWEVLLADIWRKVLCVDKLGIDDNFFELGGHSLLIVQLIHEINRAHKVSLGVAELFRQPTIRQMAALIDSKETQRKREPAIVQLKEGTAQIPLYLIHAGPDEFRLAHQMESDHPVFGIEVPWPLAWRKAVAANEVAGFPDMQQLIDRYVTALAAHSSSSPCVLAGHSFAGLIAFETARQLQQRGRAVPLVLLFDTWATHQRPYQIAWSNLKRCWTRSRQETPAIEMNLPRRLGKSWHAMRWLLRQERSRLRAVFRRNELDNQTLTTLLDEQGIPVPAAFLFRLYRRILTSYRPGRMASRGVLFCADLTDEHRLLREFDESLGWNDVFAHGLEVVPMAGNHLSMIRKHHSGLAEKVDEVLTKLEPLSRAS